MKQEDKNYLGVWIDLKKAVIIELNGKKDLVRTVESGIETRERYPGETDQSGRFAGQFIDTEKTKEQRLEKQVKEYLKKVSDTLTYTAPIVLFGPADMKQRLSKHLREHSVLKDHIAGVETSDQMTENQMVAWVKKYFGLR